MGNFVSPHHPGNNLHIRKEWYFIKTTSCLRIWASGGNFLTMGICVLLDWASIVKAKYARRIFESKKFQGDTITRRSQWHNLIPTRTFAFQIAEQEGLAPVPPPPPWVMTSRMIAVLVCFECTITLIVDGKEGPHRIWHKDGARGSNVCYIKYAERSFSKKVVYHSE